MDKSSGTSPIFERDDLDNLRQTLLPLSVRGLQEMFDKDHNLFSCRAIRTGQGVRNEGLSLRYTLISLLGLAEWEKRGERSPVDIHGVLSRFPRRARDIDNIGDLGLFLWLMAVASPGMVDRAWSEHNMEEAVFQYREARQGRTMELAWFLSGLSHAKLQQAEKIRGLNEAADLTFRQLIRNYGRYGIFRHIGKSTSTGLIRGRIGNFADQVYPIYALSKFSRAFGSRTALDVALHCAETLCRLQGPRGQWWWHYDAATGRVIGRYPVYSVHQDGMAPMALSAVGEATGIDFREPIDKGLRWVEGNNELGVNMIDSTRNVIWRCLERNKYKLVASLLFSMVNHSHRERDYNDLKILYECRSYHLGWLLYALGNRNITAEA